MFYTVKIARRFTWISAIFSLAISRWRYSSSCRAKTTRLRLSRKYARKNGGNSCETLSSNFISGLTTAIPTSTSTYSNTLETVTTSLIGLNLTIPETSGAYVTTSASSPDRESLISLSSNVNTIARTTSTHTPLITETLSGKKVWDTQDARLSCTFALKKLQTA